MDLADLSPADRRLLGRLAEAAGTTAEAMLPEIVTAWLRLLRDAPDALPANPLAPVVHGARSRAAR